MKALVIGGTGPTGPHIVNGLVDRGHTVTILHTGRHEVDTIPAQVEHIHTDPFDEDALLSATAQYAEHVASITYAEFPGWTFGYYGPRKNPGGVRGSFRR